MWQFLKEPKVFLGATLYTCMKFRTFIATPSPTTTGVPLDEADLLGVPSSGSSSEGAARSVSGKAKASGPEEPQRIGTGPPPRQMDDQLRTALALTGQLGKVLAGLPHPWNQHFAGHVRHLQALMAKLKDI